MARAAPPPPQLELAAGTPRGPTLPPPLSSGSNRSDSDSSPSTDDGATPDVSVVPAAAASTSTARPPVAATTAASAASTGASTPVIGSGTSSISRPPSSVVRAGRRQAGALMPSPPPSPSHTSGSTPTPTPPAVGVPVFPRHRRLDRYGFFVDGDGGGGVGEVGDAAALGVATEHLGDPHLPHNARILAPPPAAVRLENVRLGKWLAMLADWRAARTRSPARLLRRVRKGVPDAVRGRVWMLLAEADVLKAEHPGLYASLLGRRPRRSDEECILLDLPRTMPNHYLFAAGAGGGGGGDGSSGGDSSSGGPAASPLSPSSSLLADAYLPPGQRALRNVLMAYAVFDPDVGYCQGMAFATSLLLSYMPEEDAFFMLHVLMRSPRYALAGMYSPGLPRYAEVVAVFGDLVRDHLPALARHMQELGIDHTMYASQWFITIFTYNLPFDIVTRVWDMFLLEGWKAVYRMALALLKVNQGALLTMDFEHVIERLKALAVVLPPQRIVDTALSIRLPQAEVERRQSAYRLEHQTELRARVDAAIAEAARREALLAALEAAAPPIAVDDATAASPTDAFPPSSRTASVSSLPPATSASRPRDTVDADTAAAAPAQPAAVPVMEASAAGAAATTSAPRRAGSAPTMASASPSTGGVLRAAASMYVSATATAAPASTLLGAAMVDAGSDAEDGGKGRGESWYATVAPPPPITDADAAVDDDAGAGLLAALHISIVSYLGGTGNIGGSSSRPPSPALLLALNLPDDASAGHADLDADGADPDVGVAALKAGGSTTSTVPPTLPTLTAAAAATAGGAAEASTAKRDSDPARADAEWDVVTSSASVAVALPAVGGGGGDGEPPASASAEDEPAGVPASPPIAAARELAAVAFVPDVRHRSSSTTSGGASASTSASAVPAGRAASFSAPPPPSSSAVVSGAAARARAAQAAAGVVASAGDSGSSGGGARRTHRVASSVGAGGKGAVLAVSPRALAPTDMVAVGVLSKASAAALKAGPHGGGSGSGAAAAGASTAAAATAAAASGAAAAAGAGGVSRQFATPTRLRRAGSAPFVAVGGRAGAPPPTLAEVRIMGSKVVGVAPGTSTRAAPGAAAALAADHSLPTAKLPPSASATAASVPGTSSGIAAGGRR